MKQLLFLIGFCCLGYTLQAQSILEAEYFFNTDPGVGLGNVVSVDTNTGKLSQSFPVETTGLDEGFHALYLRTKNSEGNWSHYDRSLFYMRSTNFGDNIVAAEYYFDDNDGNGIGVSQGEPLTIDAPDANVVQSFSLETAGLLDGFHSLHLRTRDAFNNWSHYDRSLFYMRSTNFGDNIVAAEYYFDDNDGNGIGVSQGELLTIDTPDANVVQSFSLETAGLSDGFHSLHLRTRDAFNNWSHYDRSLFYLESVLPSADIEAAEYYFDNNDGNGIGVTQGEPLSIDVESSNITQNYMIPVTDLDEGFHMLYIRTKTTEGVWSLYDKSVIYIKNFGTNFVVEAEYFIDEDPGVGNGTRISVTGNPQGIEFDTDALEAGAHLFCVRVLDYDGDWSLYDCEVFVIDEALSTEDSLYKSTTLFPNPFVSDITIRTNRTIEKASVFNIRGQEVYSNNSVINNKLKLNGLKSGVYILKLSTVNEFATFKIIKK